MVDDQPINLQLWDTSGAEDYKKLRPLNYPQTDVFILCISLVEPRTIDGIVNELGPETKEHCPTAQRILVGLKSDIRDEMLNNPESREKYEAEGYEPIPTSRCEEVKNYEILIKTTVTNALKDFLYDKDKERGKKSFQYFAYYIINVVNRAQEPLNPSELKEKLSQLSQNAMNGRDIEGSAGGCCTIQ